ncbi:adenosylcobinamide-GDP ribazoletransferase [Sandaracinobacteroides hominis]|uniref:adenosylcobinamide-GDP ribazoletransferase n=1 Tax=Sandaracinobacteroides hominis TaxID=2780086 RepID=UPI0018F51809|nr:adenosylcobinamide-GDP ribazoletransferase [Sandaracinobacteroides hominis]
MKGAIAAIAFLTRLPVPQRWADVGAFPSAVAFYPLAGLLIGLLLAGVGWAGALIDPWLGALFATLLWAALTGALHLDGLADLADGLGAAHGDRDRLLTVMADPHVGSFGVVALVLQLLAKLVLLQLLLPHGWLLLVLVPAAARIGPLVWARMLPPLKPSGLGAAIAQAAAWPAIAAWMLVLAAGCWFAPPLLATFLLLPALALWFRHRVGGMTGDVHGAGIELAETGLLLAAAVYLAA